MIYNYGYKPTPNFLPDESFVRYMGVELEIDRSSYSPECKRSCSDELSTIDPEEEEFYQKSDGSLRCGIEVVSHPATLDYHLNTFPWGRIVEIAKKHDYSSHEVGTCGLHVHVSRKAFGEDTTKQDLNIAKTMLMFNGFWKNVVKFSRREQHQLRWANKNRAKLYCDDNDSEVISKSKQSRTRYQAINLRNRSTVEFRVFRGTLKVQTIKATLQFLNNLIDIAIDTPLQKLDKVDWYDIIHNNNYPELINYAIERELDVHKKISGAKSPLFGRMTVKEGVPLIKDGKLNPEAFTLERVKEHNLGGTNGHPFHTGDIVGIYAPRSHTKIETIGSVVGVTGKSVKVGQGYWNYKTYRATRVVPIVSSNSQASVVKFCDFYNWKYANIDGNPCLIRFVTDMNTVPLYAICNEHGLNRVEYITDNLANKYNPVNLTSLTFINPENGNTVKVISAPHYLGSFLVKEGDRNKYVSYKDLMKYEVVSCAKCA